jgi:hypothetical protein
LYPLADILLSHVDPVVGGDVCVLLALLVLLFQGVLDLFETLQLLVKFFLETLPDSLLLLLREHNGLDTGGKEGLLEFRLFDGDLYFLLVLFLWNSSCIIRLLLYLLFLLVHVFLGFKQGRVGFDDGHDFVRVAR